MTCLLDVASGQGPLVLLAQTTESGHSQRGVAAAVMEKGGGARWVGHPGSARERGRAAASTGPSQSAVWLALETAPKLAGQ